MSGARGGPKPIDRRTPFKDLPELVTVEELATFLAIGRTLAYELVRTGQVESRRFGRIIRIPKSALARHEASS